MSLGYISGYDWVNIEPMKYWSAPATASNEEKKEKVRNAIFSGEYLGTLKVDGYYQRLIKDEDGNCFMIARSRNTKGEVVDKYAWVPHIHEWMNSLPNGSCLLAEAYLPNLEGSKNVTSILGCLKDKAIDRQKTTPLHFHIFDCMAFAGLNFKDVAYERRIRWVKNISTEYPNEYVQYADFYEGADLWEQLQSYLAEGREGMVIMRKDAIVYTKRTPARVSIKVKQELKQTIDCVISGANSPTKLYLGKSLETWPYWINDITDERLEVKPHEVEYRNGTTIVPVTKNYYYKWAGSLRLSLYKDGKAQYFGDLSGLTEEILSNWSDYIGKVCEVGGMSIDPESEHIRHPRFLGWRNPEDKRPEECVWEQVL